MFDHDIVSLPAGQDFSNTATTPVGTRVKWTPTGVQVANAGDIAIGTLWRGNDAQQIPNLYIYTNTPPTGPAVAVKLFVCNGIPWGIVGADAAAFNVADQVCAGDNGTYVHGAGPVVAQVVTSAPANSQGGMISVILLLGNQAFLWLIAALLAFAFLAAPTHSLGALPSNEPVVPTMTGTYAPSNLPVASPPAYYYSVNTTGSAVLYAKFFPTTLTLTSSSASLFSPVTAPYILQSGTVTPLWSGSTVALTTTGTTQFIPAALYATSGTAAAPIVSGSTVTYPANGVVVTGTQFTLMNCNQATVSGSATITATGWWILGPVGTTGTVPVAAAQ